jgi:CO/xanthine dehydrogenase FAD-binding subunit
MLLNPLQLHTPTSLKEALELYGSLPNVKIQAGGTFLLNSLKLLKRNGARTPDHVISLYKVKELRGIDLAKDYLDIYSMTTITDLFEFPKLEDNFAVLKKMCRNISTTPIRNMATVGGNLTCRYTWTEVPAAMIGLDAKLHFMSKDGKEEVLGAEEFMKNAAKTDKILVKVRIQRDKEAKLSYQRVKKTMFMDIPLLSICFKTYFKNGAFESPRIGINNCVMFAQRDAKLEGFLNGAKADEKIAEQALDHLDSAIYDTRSTDYKKHMFRVCIKNAILETIKLKS